MIAFLRRRRAASVAVMAALFGAAGLAVIYPSIARTQGSLAAQMNSERSGNPEWPDGPTGVHCPPRWDAYWHQTIYVCGGGPNQDPNAWRPSTANTLESLVRTATANDPSGWSAKAISVFRNQYAGGARLPSGGAMGSQIAQFGRFVASQAGAGTCTRHFYNNSNFFWGIAMIHAGTCHLDGQPGQEMCLIPPHTTAELDYDNMGGGPAPAGVAIASAHPGATYAITYTLRAVGCYIEHDGATGNAVLNDSADGDVVAFW